MIAILWLIFSLANIIIMGRLISVKMNQSTLYNPSAEMWLLTIVSFLSGPIASAFLIGFLYKGKK